MNYSQTLDYIGAVGRSGSVYGTERMRELLTLLGEPDKRLKFVHVAGTNGKGSVTAYLTCVLRAAGYRTGTFNSPPVFCYNEFCLINGEPLCDAEVAKYVSAVREGIDNENVMRSAFGLEAFAPTAFEIETAAAMLAFYDNGCDICVLEVGVGGRLDATNVIEDKELAVITPIALDHCGLLGNGLAEIAAEKAGVIKTNAATCAQAGEIMAELKKPIEKAAAEGRRAELSIAKNPELISFGFDGQSFKYEDEIYNIKMLGKNQLQNASIAICAVEALRRRGWEISRAALKKGLESAVWHGRFEIVRCNDKRFNVTVPQDKTLVLDGAHNPHGAESLKANLDTYCKNDKIHLVLGILADKDVEGIVKRLAPSAERITTVQSDSPRALNRFMLLETVKKYCPRCDSAADVSEAVRSALLGDCGVVALCGSLTLMRALTQSAGDE